MHSYRCIALKTDMVTASYCTDPMQALHQDAVDAGITVVNEVTCPFIRNYWAWRWKINTDQNLHCQLMHLIFLSGRCWSRNRPSFSYGMFRWSAYRYRTFHLVLYFHIFLSSLYTETNFQVAERSKVSFPIAAAFLLRKHQTILLDTSFLGHQEEL